MKHYFSIFALAAVLLGTASCSKDPDREPDNQIANRDEVIYLWASKQEPDAGQGASKIVYHDGLGLNGKGEAGFKMEWEKGDVLYAILWTDDEQGKPKQATDKYIVLTSTQTTAGSEMLFQGVAYGGLKISELTGGEHFVLVHGHFVLDPSTDGGVIDFPTSEVTKAGYASHIHYGGLEEGGALTFRGQDGTLANLKKHEYMVADAYVRFQEVTEEGEPVIRPYLGSTKGGSKDNPDPNPTGVKMRSAHTLIRLTMLLPDDMFDANIDNKLLAVSFRESQNSPIFHRYFRLHPNTPNVTDPTKWKVDWNDKADKESNFYFRANLPGTRAYNEVNDPKSSNFDQSKTVCVAGAGGHYVTLYFSLPSRPLAPDAAQGTPSNLFATVFTRTHAFRSINTYHVNNASMTPGHIATVNVNFTGNYKQTKAVTDPNLGVTFAPGLVYATRAGIDDNTPWTYGVYENQGEYAGLDQQTDEMGDYFIFGSINPQEVFHQVTTDGGANWQDSKYWKPGWNSQTLKIVVDANSQATTGTTDVAALAVVKNINNVFCTMSKKEAERVWKRILEESKQGINRGYYYYDASVHDIDDMRHTAHQAKGAWIGLPADDKRRQMSSTMGIWIGINRQPTLEEQDQYVFLPSSNQLNNSTKNMDPYYAEAAVFEDVQRHRYWASKDYGNQHAICLTQAEYDALSQAEQDLYTDIPTHHDGGVLHHYYLTDDLNTEYTATLKFSTNTRDLGTGATCERFQVWYQSGKSFHDNSGIKPMDQTFGRVVRPVIY